MTTPVFFFLLDDELESFALNPALNFGFSIVGPLISPEGPFISTDGVFTSVESFIPVFFFFDEDELDFFCLLNPKLRLGSFVFPFKSAVGSFPPITIPVFFFLLDDELESFALIPALNFGFSILGPLILAEGPLTSPESLIPVFLFFDEDELDFFCLLTPIFKFGSLTFPFKSAVGSFPPMTTPVFFFFLDEELESLALNPAVNFGFSILGPLISPDGAFTSTFGALTSAESLIPVFFFFDDDELDFFCLLNPKLRLGSFVFPFKSPVGSFPPMTTPVFFFFLDEELESLALNPALT